MITIEVDCNSDEINLRDKNGNLIAMTKVQYPDKFIQMFQRIFDNCNEGRDEIGVQLTKIDEDNRTTVGEW